MGPCFPVDNVYTTFLKLDNRQTIGNQITYHTEFKSTENCLAMKVSVSVHRSAAELKRRAQLYLKRFGSRNQTAHRTLLNKSWQQNSDDAYSITQQVLAVELRRHVEHYLTWQQNSHDA